MAILIKWILDLGSTLEDACELHWNAANGHSVDFTCERPMFIIRGALEKGKRDRLLPMAPEFAELLAQVPADSRRGRVFEPQAKRPGGPAPLQHRIGETVAAIGKAADVVVDTNPKTGNPTKYASAHDLRRAFGERWAKRVMPAVLQKLMRHASIQTTMPYYVSLEADDTADLLWRALGNTAPKPTSEPIDESNANTDRRCT